MKHWLTYPLVTHPYEAEFVSKDGIVRFARAAEAAGFAGIGFTDHPAPSHKWLSAGGHDALDPFVALTMVATVTEHVRLIPNIVVLPYRNPFLTAKAAATLDALSGGRFVLSVATGYLRSEYRALGVDFEQRNALFDEALAVLRDAWAGGEISFHGEHVSFEHVMVTPDPVHVPLILGGNTEPALRRAARVADGWFSSGNPTFEEAVRLRDRLAELADDAGRSLPVYVRMAGRDPAALAGYAAHGFEHVTVWANQLWPEQGDLATKQAGFADAAAALLSAVR